VFIPYVYLGGGTWAPVNGFVDRFERIAGKPPVYSFRSTVQLSLGSTILLTIYYYSTTANAGYLTPIDIGYVSSVKSEAVEYVYEYEVDSFLTMLYDAPFEITSSTPLSTLVSSIVGSINASTGLRVSYSPRGFEASISIEPKAVSKFSDLLSKVLKNNVDYVFHFGALEFMAPSTFIGSITPYLVAVRSNSLIDGYYDTFSPITILDNSSNYEAVPSSMGSSGLLKRRLLKVVTKPTRVSVIVWVPPSNTVCLDKTYSEACIALDYKLQGEIEVWKIVPTTPVPPGEIPQDYQLVFKLCCRGEVGSERASGCDYSVDMRANEEKDRLVLTFRDEVVGDGSYFLVVMDAIKVFYIEDDSVGYKQLEVYPLGDYGDVNLFPDYPSGTYFLLSRDGDYIKSRDQRLYLIAKTNPLSGLSEMVMVPGRPFFKKNTLKPEGNSLPGLLVNVVMERGAVNHLVSKIRFDGERLIYEFKPLEHYTSYIEAVEGLRRRYGVII
jgi:hypothetical protein